MSTSQRPRHLVVGAGPVGRTIAMLLAERGDEVVVMTRSGSAPTHPQIKAVKADASDAAALTTHATGAATIFNCVNPPYHQWPTAWPPMHSAMMQAAERTGGVLVMIDNLYSFGPGSSMPMREDSPMLATGKKGAVRAAMARDLLEGHASGRFRATLARASDFFGPEVRDAAFGERLVPKIIAGKKVMVLGSLDVPHSMSYLPDVAATMVAIASAEAAWGKAWHVPNAPARTQRELVAALAAAAGTTPKVGALPHALLSVLGLFVAQMRELKETWYQFDEPFVTDSTVTEQALGLSATPLAAAAEATVAWWRRQLTR